MATMRPLEERYDRIDLAKLIEKSAEKKRGRARRRAPRRDKERVPARFEALWPLRSDEDEGPRTRWTKSVPTTSIGPNVQPSPAHRPLPKRQTRLRSLRDAMSQPDGRRRASSDGQAR
jgi:hypothetical protein